MRKLGFVPSSAYAPDAAGRFGHLHALARGRPPAGGLPCFAPEGAKQTLFLGAYIPMTPTMNGIQAAMISTRAIEGTTPVLNMSPKV